MKSSAQGEYILKLRCEKTRTGLQQKSRTAQRAVWPKTWKRQRPRLAQRQWDFFLLVTLGAFSCAGPNIRTSWGRMRHRWEGTYMPRNLNYILEASTFFKFSGAAQIRHTFYITTWCTHICIYNWKKHLQNNTHTFCMKFILMFSISYFWMFDANPQTHQLYPLAVKPCYRPQRRQESFLIRNWQNQVNLGW